MSSSMNIWPWAWWSILVGINIVSFLWCCYIYWGSAKANAHNGDHYPRRMRILGLVFVSVALYRSIFVSSYYEQLAWFDILANSSLIIRGLAFFAELSFASLFMFAMLRFNKELPVQNNTGQSRLLGLVLERSPYVILICIFIAQFFATTALIFKIELFFAIEETLWGLAFLSVLPLALMQLLRVYQYSSTVEADRLRPLKIFATMNASWCVIYCSYSFFYHLPIELWPHVIDELQAGKFALKSGFGAVADALFLVNETKGYSQWGGINFVIWHTGYFSVSVWMVLFLMTGPRLKTAAKSS